jgi:4-hydroxymandelate oxidase
MITDEARGIIDLGPTAAPALTMEEVESQAAAVLPPDVYGDVAGGAGAEVTMQANERAWEALGLTPRVLRDVREVTASVELLGASLSTPVLLAPGGRQRRLHPDGEIASARGAARAGGLMVLSTFATTSIEELADAVPTCNRWFQLYLTVDRSWSESLVQRAAAAGYRAIVFTVDAPVPGLRLRALRNPAQSHDTLAFANFGGNERLVDASRNSTGGGFDPGLTWNDLSWLVEISPLPVLVKGVLRADDAKECVRHGAAGIVVSNHGGRQMDGAIPTAVALARIASAIGDEVPLLVDGGIRTGADVLKAIAMGASAVLVGRPMLWGLALGGEAGVHGIVNYLTQELRRAMRLCGARSLDEITTDLLDIEPATTSP